MPIKRCKHFELGGDKKRKVFFPIGIFGEIAALKHAGWRVSIIVISYFK